MSLIQPHERIPFGRPMIGHEERQVVHDVLNSPQLVHGPRASEFEAAFAAFLGENASATSVSSCTAGLHLAYLHLGIGPGDEVIVPAQTHVATAHAVRITGATPVFVDCDATGNIDPEQISSKMTSRTRAICVVHYLGLPVEMDAVLGVARKYSLPVVEDCALAIGGYFNGVACGLLGDIASFSFYPVKHMTTGEGGMVVARDPEIIESIRGLKAFGYDRSPAARTVPGVYDIARLGINYRMSETAAAMGSVQLKRVPDFARQREANAAALRSALADSPHVTLLPGSDSKRVHANYCLVALIQGAAVGKRDQITLRMREAGVGTSVYYPVPLPLSRYYQEEYGAKPEEFPNALRISSSSVALPIGPHLDEGDMTIIAQELNDAVRSVG